MDATVGDSLGVAEAVAMALGGMIGGGIAAAFGIGVAISGTVAWVAFLVACVVLFWMVLAVSPSLGFLAAFPVTLALVRLGVKEGIETRTGMGASDGSSGGGQGQASD